MEILLAVRSWGHAECAFENCPKTLERVRILYPASFTAVLMDPCIPVLQEYFLAVVL